MKLIFATNNQNKIAEIRSALPGELEIITLKEAGIEIEIPEPHDTIEANATEKSNVIHRLTNENCFSEDTGLEVVALAGAPGVRSARYAGNEAGSAANIDLLLRNMKNITDRSAQFKTVISLVLNKAEYQFTGICKGQITTHVKGTNGFGYDALFIPDGDERTFAEMTMEEKNKYSHRKKALQQLVDFLTVIMARIKITIPQKKIFSTHLPVRISDINYGNHLGNDALVSLLHEARVQWLASGNYTELNIEGIGLIQGDLAVEYKNESYYGDTLLISLAIDEIQKASFEIFYEITTERNGSPLIIAKAKTGMVCFNYETKKVAGVPEKFIEFLD